LSKESSGQLLSLERPIAKTFFSKNKKKSTTAVSSNGFESSFKQRIIGKDKFPLFSPKGSFTDSFAFLKKDYIEVFQNAYIGQNLIAGITVAAVALPLNLALAIAAGLPASTGLIAGAIGGAFAALFGGSRFQATGPAAALNVMVFVIVQQFGAMGAAAVALLMGLLQIILSLASAGSLIRFVPEGVLIGFTTGVGIKLLDTQLPKVFGIEWTANQMFQHIMNPIWLHEVTWLSVLCGLFVIFFILACRIFPKFPAALVGILVTTQLVAFLEWPIHKVGEIPPLALSLSLPNFALNDWWKLFQLALPIGLLAAAESLLSAQAVDRLSGDKHHSNLELFGQGLANLASGLFTGMPVSGVIVRSTVSVQAGARNRLAGFFHAGVLLASALFLSGAIAKVPIASLAGLLCIIGYRLIEFGGFFHLLKTNKFEALAFLTAAIGTVTNHIVLGLGLGLALMAIEKLLEKNQKAKSKSIEKVSYIPDSHKDSKVFQLLDRGERWLQHLKQQAHIPNSAYVHPNSSVIGRVILGKNVHIAAEASVRADEGTPFYIGDNTNIQDGVVIHALKQKWVKIHNRHWAVYIGKEVSLAHQALVHGPCSIGDNSFIGFKAVVHDSTIGNGCYIGIGAVVVGVEVPDEKYIPHGAVIDNQEKVRSLVRVSPLHKHFNEDVVEVNKGLAEAYRELANDQAIEPAKNFRHNNNIHTQFEYNNLN
jgi:SulP family sulfate permease